MTPDEMAVLLTTIQSTPLAMASLEAAAEAIDAEVSVEIVTGLLRAAAEHVIDQHPLLMVSPATLTAILATITRGIRQEHEKLLAVDG